MYEIRTDTYSSRTGLLPLPRQSSSHAQPTVPFSCSEVYLCSHSSYSQYLCPKQEAKRWKKFRKDSAARLSITLGLVVRCWTAQGSGDKAPGLPIRTPTSPEVFPEPLRVDIRSLRLRGLRPILFNRVDSVYHFLLWNPYHAHLSSANHGM